MLQEPPELVAMRFALGQQLAARREAAGIIQPQIARKTGYSRSSVAHAEAGRQLLTREFWQAADELLQADGALLAGYEQVRSAKEEHEARSREAELARAYAEAQARAQELRAATSSSSTEAVRSANGPVVPTGQEVPCGRGRRWRAGRRPGRTRSRPRSWYGRSAQSGGYRKPITPR